ncbi:MAG: YggS family pyridoxal phosphate-dependent enzyme [Lewinella sp.]|nr:YggS family pyridoxal phosphate-dependent enzyme [Lewinella sp.]
MELSTILAQLAPYQAQLVAVSKTHPPERIMPLYEQGQRDFGENKVQELTDKQPVMPADIHWHFIGHLQTNKVKYIAPFVHLIHSVDSTKLLKEINKRAAQNERVIDVLLQFHIAEESTKFGLDLAEAKALLEDPRFADWKNVRIVGVMGMATFTEDERQVTREFQHLRQIFQELQAQYFADQPAFKELSMGMSDDYELALEAGSTMVRVGSLLFGPRE